MSERSYHGATSRSPNNASVVVCFCLFVVVVVITGCFGLFVCFGVFWCVFCCFILFGGGGKGSVELKNFLLICFF